MGNLNGIHRHHHHRGDHRRHYDRHHHHRRRRPSWVDRRRVEVGLACHHGHEVGREEVGLAFQKDSGVGPQEESAWRVWL